MAASAGVALAMVVCGWFGPGRALVERMDRAVGDWIIRYSGGPPERPDFVMLGIDEASLARSIATREEIEASESLTLMGERFPWDRRVWAHVIDRLADAGAKLIVFDLIFSEPTDPESDAAFAEAIARHKGRVVLASMFAFAGEDTGDGSSVLLVEPIEDFLGESWDTSVGFVNFYTNPVDGLVRSARYTTTPGWEVEGLRREGEPVYRSLAAEVIRELGGTPPSGEHDLRFSSRMKTGGAEIYSPRSVSGIFVEDIWERNYESGRFFKDKVVMVGPTAPRFHDIVSTPVGPITGPQMHLQAAACGLDGAFVRRITNPWPGMLVLGAVALGWTQLVRRPLISIFGLMGIVAAVAGIVVWQGAAMSVLLPVSGGIFALVAGSGVAQSYDLLVERLEKQRLRHEFRRFVSRDVADALVEHPEQWLKTSLGVKRRVVVLFSDVRGFTSRSERTDPADLVKQLNEYLSVMVQVVFRNGGTLDKFIGDAVMAHWGALGGGDDREHSTKALQAAREMIEELNNLNERWAAGGEEPFQIGVGLHLGEAVAGEIGSPDRTEFGVIGDAVNLASRLEGLTKVFGCDVVFSEEVRQAAAFDGPLIELGKVRVKGRIAPVELFGLGQETAVRERLGSLERDPGGVIVRTSK